MNWTIEKEKILKPFIILGVKPTSTPRLKRDQLVLVPNAKSQIPNKAP
jgi:hypothetical protein